MELDLMDLVDLGREKMKKGGGSGLVGLEEREAVHGLDERWCRKDCSGGREERFPCFRSGEGKRERNKSVFFLFFFKNRI